MKYSIPSIALLIVIVLVFAYYNFPSWMDYSPRCAIKYFTGFSCPSCGNQRALFYILHGNIREAAFCNLGNIYIVICGVLAGVMRLMKMRKIDIYLFYFLFTGYFVWFVLRNIIGL